MIWTGVVVSAIRAHCFKRVQSVSNEKNLNYFLKILIKNGEVVSLLITLYIHVYFTPFEIQVNKTTKICTFERNNTQTAFTNIRNNKRINCTTDFYNIELDVSYASTYIFRSDP